MDEGEISFTENSSVFRSCDDEFYGKKVYLFIAQVPPP